jgi:nucleoid DNA-binding protein
MQLIEQWAAVTGQVFSGAEKNINAFISLIYDHLRKGRVVNISGFGQFSVSHRAPRTGVNPRHPENKITIPELNTPKFKAGEAFKSAIKLRK